MRAGGTILTTERLRLSTWTEASVDEVLELFSDPEVTRYLDPPGRIWTRAMAAERLREWQQEYKDTGLCKFRVSRRNDGMFVGRAGFSLLPDRGPELAYTLAHSSWGQGYASELASALRDWFFATRGEGGFIAFCHLDNAASCRVLEKTGMRPTHQGEMVGLPCQFFAIERPEP